MFDSRWKVTAPHPVLRLGFIVALAYILPACTSEQTTGKHLFILSGQSNMTGTLKMAFTDRVQERFGEENAVVVMRMKSGRGIRFWVADYRQPSDRGLADKKMNSNGQEYKPLIDVALAAVKDRSFDTVGFIWMQGESDGLNGLSRAYKESFLKLMKRFRKDMDRDDLYFVIGRISDYGLGGTKREHWQRVRDVQVGLGESTGNAWIDTDDLNGGDESQPYGDLHYPRQGSVILGQRFADKAIELIDRR